MQPIGRILLAALTSITMLACLDASARYDVFAWRYTFSSGGCGGPVSNAALARLGNSATPEEACEKLWPIMTMDRGMCTPAGTTLLAPNAASCLGSIDYANPPFISNTVLRVTRDTGFCEDDQEYHLNPGVCCPRGQGIVNGQCAPAIIQKQIGTPQASTCCANPIALGIANKFQAEEDYIGPGPMPLRFVRYYNSRSTQDNGVSFGAVWSHTYARRIRVLSTVPETVADALREDGKILRFYANAGQWLPLNDVNLSLVASLDAGGQRIGWRLVTEDDTAEEYDASGRLTKVTNRAGLSHTLTYSDATTPPSVAVTPGLLIRVTDNFGKQLNFEYGIVNRVARMVDPDGGVYAYQYENLGMLTAVTYPGNVTRAYHYNEQDNTAGTNQPSALTGIIDENGSRFATYKYDAQGRAVSSEHAGGVEKSTVQYNPDGSAIVTDPLSNARTYGFALSLGVARVTSLSGPGYQSPNFAAASYDANGYEGSRTDFNGNVTTYQRNDPQGRKDLETSRTEALGTAQARSITTTWHSTLRLPTLISEPGRTTAMGYDATGNLLTRTITDTASGRTRTWTYTYNGNGQVLTIDGPRTDVSDVTTYTYYANNESCNGSSATGCRGQIQSITNAAGHRTDITEYNAHGQPLSITDPNGLVTTLAYDARQRLTSRSVGGLSGETTSYEYDGVGQLTRVTLPDRSFLSYTYDAAHRLTQSQDNLGNRIAYTLDLTGNRTKECVFAAGNSQECTDPASLPAQVRRRAYDNLNRLVQEIGAQSQTTTYGYDNQGNLTSIDGPLPGTLDVTTNTYDALNRLILVTDPNAGQVNYGYNALDQLTSIRDPRSTGPDSFETKYGYDGLNNLNQLASPDTGTTVNTYDAAGNILTLTDAKGQVTTYTYDALNRVTSITYQGGVVHTYQYDQGSNGLGRLTQITEPNSTTQYAYDQKGRLRTETRTINAIAYVTSYNYDSSGRLTDMTYPGGRQVVYTLDSLGRIEQIVTAKDGTVRTVLSNAAYRPFGPPQSFIFGNGQTSTRSYDLDGRIGTYTLGTQTFVVGYDPASRVSSIFDQVNQANVNTYGYDNLDRLTSSTVPNAAYGYSYDAVGNRAAQTVGANQYTLTYGTANNRLSSTTGPIAPRTFTYDLNGSETGDGANTFGYDTRGRMGQAISVAGTTN